MAKSDAVSAFRQLVSLKYHLYNSLFLTLPFDRLKQTGIKLPVFTEMCKQGLAKGERPDVIVQRFMSEILHTDDFDEIKETLFLFLQLVERQVVLFDALEDAAFTETHDLHGSGTLGPFLDTVRDNGNESVLEKVGSYSARLVLTAHPTQFYPESILNIISDLSRALKKDNLAEVEGLLLQMGMTSFRNPIPPTPLSEAQNLIKRYTPIFFEVFTRLQKRVEETLNPLDLETTQPAVQLGFWPGGDRDGNPNVTVETTKQTASSLKAAILDCYIDKIHHLERRLTFKGTQKPVQEIKKRLADTRRNAEHAYPNSKAFAQDLSDLREILVADHQSLFTDQIDELTVAVRLFGFHLASLDLRQDSRVHGRAVASILDKEDSTPYLELDSKAKIQRLLEALQQPPPQNLSFEETLSQDVLDSLKVTQSIQKSNGVQGLHRYIISNCRGAHNVLEVQLLAYWAGWALESLQIDIIPLFETIEDLKEAPRTMEQLFSCAPYQEHLKRREQQQTIMLGFSDGTKDGGYVACNWSIFRCKEALFRLAQTHSVNVTFFDGRGGPPARGGGNTHRFYRAMGYQFPQQGVELTIQGQTISSKFGTIPSAQYNTEQLYTAGMECLLFPQRDEKLHRDQEELMEKLSALSLEAYRSLRKHPSFIPFLEKMTPLSYYGSLNIASRPPKRGGSSKLSLDDLRAIPFVGAWSQIKINIPGFYGLGTALESLIEKGWLKILQQFYKNSLFFRTMLDNAQMALSKSHLPLTQYIKNDPEFGSFWDTMEREMQRTTQAILSITQQDSLLQREPLIQASIHLREELILPLLVIQQYAMIQLRENPPSSCEETLSKLVLKSIPSNINASRNSA